MITSNLLKKLKMLRLFLKLSDYGLMYKDVLLAKLSEPVEVKLETEDSK